MARITGVSVLAREVQPDDVIMNEWTRKTMRVERVHLIHGDSVKLFCVREDDGRPETLNGSWDGITRLIVRATPAYEPEE
jgi:hypothetical protein